MHCQGTKSIAICYTAMESYNPLIKGIDPGCAHIQTLWWWLYKGLPFSLISSVPATSIAERKAHLRWEWTIRLQETKQNKTKETYEKQLGAPFKSTQLCVLHGYIADYSLWLKQFSFLHPPTKISAQLRCLALGHGIGSVSYCCERTWHLTTFKPFSVDWAF